MTRVLRKAGAAARRLARIGLVGINSVWAIPAVLVMRAVRPWVRVRVGQLGSDRIGHFVPDAALHLAQRTLEPPNERAIELFWFPRRTSNAQWAGMVRRTLLVGPWVRYLITFNRLIPGGSAHAPRSTHGSRDIHGLLARSPSRFDFTAQEEESAKRWLRRRGWKDGEPFLCLLVRDSAYLARHSLHANVGRDAWAYHAYRDSDIAPYVEAMQALTARGYWVIRMGKLVHKRVGWSHPRVIDYPFVDDQNDLLDIWLAANCQFFISTGAGIDMVATVYRRPVVFVNFVPLGYLHSFAQGVCVPKTGRWADTGRPLTLSELLDHSYLRSRSYEQAGMILEDLPPAHITAAVLEQEERLSGTWRETPDDRARQQRFWTVLRAWRDFPKYHNYIHPEARVGSAWLNAMGPAFLE